MSTLPEQIESLFDRHPALCGFSVRSLDELPDNCPRDEDDALFVGDIGISHAMSTEQYGQMFQEIVVTLAQWLAEEPEAEELLSGRTFARALH
ncbi:MAG TPA: hypothetical protein VFB93_20395 [Burkholderiales bacterium]|nr:hypothetical protein [Burkholderiales bacterium]